MRSLGIHSAEFRCQARDRAGDGAEALPNDAHELKVEDDCLVIFVAVERADSRSPASVARQLADDTIKRAGELKVGTVVLYPYVHLTDDPATPRVARKTLDEIERRLVAVKGIALCRAPFGWYKSFSISCLGHPLSEWSGRFEAVASERRSRGEGHARELRNESSYLVVDLEGRSHELDPERFKEPDRGRPELAHLYQLLANELGAGPGNERPPGHIAVMQRHELVDYCEVSEKGHLKWYPKGVLIQRLLLDAAAELARDWGAIEIKNPLILRGDHNEIGELMREFHERDYEVDGGRGPCYLRYASDPLAFPYLQKVRFSHRQTPLRVYEEASCFRNEFQGEVSGLKRVRNFLMTDMHAACASVEEAKAELENLSLRFGALMDRVIAPGRWVLAWEGVRDFYEEHRDWLISLSVRLGVPALFKLSSEMKHYYAMKSEYQVITGDLANLQVATVQWDVKDGERFGIGFVDEHGEKRPCPVILHASSFGSIERALCGIIEHALADGSNGKPPMLPVWLAPTQLRVVPVSDQHLPYAMSCCERLASHRIRVDIDDRDAALGRKIRDAEQEWVPYVAIVGAREERCGGLALRRRRDGGRLTVDVSSLASELEESTAGMPFRPLPLPRRLSLRPGFR